MPANLCRDSNLFNSTADDYVPESWEDDIDDFAESFILTGTPSVDPDST